MHPDIKLPFAEPPGRLASIEVAPGILWLRIPLPFRLDHVNIYLIADGPSWVIFDTGLGDAPTIALWEELLAGPLAGFRFSRLICSHSHPDHVGMAGWLVKRFGFELAMSYTDFLMAQITALTPGALEGEHYAEFFRSHGLDARITASITTRGHAYLRLVTGLPPVFRRLIAGETITIGKRQFEILTGGGHSAEQVMLYCRAERIFLAADQAMLRITPNVSVIAVDPKGDPLGIYLRSLEAIGREIHPDALVLPGHHAPFHGLHARTAEIRAHHEERCALILESCAKSPLSAADLVPILFPRVLDPHQMGFAFSEVLAHTNFMQRDGRLEETADADGILRLAPRKVAKSRHPAKP